MQVSIPTIFFFFAAGVALLLGSVFPSVLHARDDAEGRAAYVDYGCFQCHGYDGQGGGFTGPRIAPDPMPWEAFRHQVRKPYGSMPAYSPRVLSDVALKKIYEYVRSIPAPQAVGDIPVLKETQ